MANDQAFEIEDLAVTDEPPVRTPIRVVITVSVGDQTEVFDADAAAATVNGDAYYAASGLLSGLMENAQHWVLKGGRARRHY